MRPLARLVLFFALAAAPAVAAPPIERVKLPPGFEITVFAEDVRGARSMAPGSKGWLFVSTRDAGNVYAVRHDGRKALATYTIARGLNMPNGVALKDGHLYVAEVDKVWRYDNIEEKLASGTGGLTPMPKPTLFFDGFPSDRHHGWKFIRFGPDGWLYVPVGAPCNICAPDPDRYAAILRMRADGSDLQTYARGVRNSVGFDWHPETGELWFTDNGRDHLGDDAPPDELNRAPRAGLHFGYPYCHGGTVPDPRYGGERSCSDFTPPAQALAAHVAALGMRFYTGTTLGPAWRGRVFIAEHGSWNRSLPVGYRVSTVRLEGSRAVTYEPFASGWLHEGQAWGRPADVLVAPDGALLVSDDLAGAIYRIRPDNGHRRP